MTIYAAPGATFEAVLTKATSLAGTLGVRISNLVTDTDYLARSTAGIVQYPAASGIYSKSLTAPTTATSSSNAYQVVWDDTVTFTAEELIVTSSAPLVSAPSGSDLTTLADVRAALRLPTAETSQDTQLQEKITDASAHLVDAYQREFAPATSVASARVFAYRGGGILDLAPYNAQAGTITAITLDTDGTSPSTLTAYTDWSAAPLPSPWGVIDYLRVPTLFPYPRYVLSDPGHQGWRQVTVTAKWGYPAIPAPVSEACKLTVMDWFRRDGSRPGGFDAPEDLEDGGSRDVAIPQRARWLMRSFENRSLFA